MQLIMAMNQVNRSKASGFSLIGLEIYISINVKCIVDYVDSFATSLGFKQIVARSFNSTRVDDQCMLDPRKLC